MPDQDRDGAEQSGETVTKPGEGTRDEGQAFDGGRESRRMREFPGLKTADPAEKGDVG
jgi:hypothetical protein